MAYKRIANELSSMASLIPTSSVYEIFEAVNQHEQKTSVAKLHLGEPCFSPPEEVSEAVVKAVRDGNIGYGDAAGLLELREMLANKLWSENGIDSQVSDIFVCPGSCQAVSAILAAIFEPNSEILVPAMHWPVHVQQVLMAGFRPRLYPLDEHLMPDMERIRELATPNTRAILVNSPSNPSGSVISESLQTRLLEMAHDRSWHIISDEAYEHFVYTGRHFSLASLERDMPEHERVVHSIFTFSKSFAMTGYRLGYIAVANRNTATALRLVQETTLISPSLPVQYGGIAALQNSGAITTNFDLLKSNRDILLSKLHDSGLLVREPEGGWYAMLDISSSGLSGDMFSSELLKEENVAVVAGDAFMLQPQFNEFGKFMRMGRNCAASNLIRLAFCVRPDMLEVGLQGILNFIEKKRNDFAERY